MKKVILSAVSLAMLTFGMIGCKKQNPEIQNPLNNELKSSTSYEGVTTDGTILIFDSAERYEKLSSFNDDESNLNELQVFEKHAMAMNFPHIDGKLAMKQQCDHNGEAYDSEEEESIPEFLQSVLNKDGVIQIGSYIYRLDFSKELVYVIPAELRSTLYNKLILGEVENNKDVAVYAFEEEVVSMVEERKPSEVVGKTLPPNNSADEYLPILTQFETSFVAGWASNTNLASFVAQHSAHKNKLRSRYRKYGVHFSLYVWTRNTVTNVGANASYNINTGHISLSGNLSFASSPFPYRIRWQRRYIRNNSNDTGGWMCSLFENGYGEFKAQSWRGMRRLSKYTIVGRLEVQIPALSGPWLPVNWHQQYSGCNSNDVIFQTGIMKW